MYLDPQHWVCVGSVLVVRLLTHFRVLCIEEIDTTNRCIPCYKSCFVQNVSCCFWLPTLYLFTPAPLYPSWWQFFLGKSTSLPPPTHVMSRQIYDSVCLSKQP